MQCKDIPDEPVLEFLRGLDSRGGTWFHGFDNSVERAMPGVQSNRLVLAKMKSLVNRGLVDGCTCGCRGDFKITPKGLHMIAHRIAEL
jgi:hypothetical protein